MNFSCDEEKENIFDFLDICNEKEDFYYDNEEKNLFDFLDLLGIEMEVCLEEDSSVLYCDIDYFNNEGLLEL